MSVPSLYNMPESYSAVERHDDEWKYAYMGGVVDFGSNLQVRIGQASSMAVGYNITPVVKINTGSQTAMGFLDEYFGEHDINANVTTQETGVGRESYRLEVSQRESVWRFLELPRPYLIARYEAVELINDHLIPRLERGAHSSKEGFLQLVKIADRIREDTISRSEPKYTEAYFRDLWDMPDR